jgi:PPE-repeat protein
VSVTSPHFARLPPEINSALIFSGPGPGPLLAAANAWDGLAGELASSASSFSSVTSDLANGAWQGASSTAMMALATHYVNWLSAAAAQAEEVSHQASAIATAFEVALSATVQPAMVAANRALVQALAVNNHLGQNTPAIADIEAAYEQMWAADVAAMSGYHADASAAVAKIQPWQQALSGTGQLTFGPPGSVRPTQALMLGSGPATTNQGGVGGLRSGSGTGGISPTNLVSGLLNSPTASTGGLNASIGHSGLLGHAPLTSAIDPGGAVGPQPGLRPPGPA